MAEETQKDEKTEAATPRRLEEARERGQVAFSTEIVAAAGLVAAAITLALGGGALARTAGGSIARASDRLAHAGRGDLSRDDAVALLTGAAESALPPYLTVLLPMLAVVCLVGYAQVGLRLAPKAVAFDVAKLNPVQGFRRMYNARAFMRTGLSVAKLVVVGVVIAAVSWRDVTRVSALAGGDLGPTLAAVGRVLLKAALAGVVALMALAAFDLWFQRVQFARDMRMSKKEVREEHKATEGDPLVRSRIRSIQREVASRRMMAEVPDATVVVTNPTHFAVALRYEPAAGGENADAPRVVAKGTDEVAANIRRVAREAGVAVVEDPPLARALHRSCAIGDAIPEDLFGAVAALLAYVYRIQEGAPAAPGRA